MNQQFSGNSTNGDFQAALSAAIAKALATLPTDAIKWKLIAMTGLNGGFTQQNELDVTIEVNVP